VVLVEQRPDNPRGAVFFATTHWSVVLAAADQESPQAAEALEKLCRTYWYPLYAFLRRQGLNPEDAQDMIQGFFARLLERNSLAGVDRRKGRFRSFLLGALKHYVADEYDKAHAQKRGAGQPLLSCDAREAEARYAVEPAELRTPESIYEYRWAMTVLGNALSRLCEECGRSGRARLYEELKGFVSGDEPANSYEEAAHRLGLKTGAVKSAIFRLRQRHHELVREEIARTVANPTELDDEIRHLIAVVSR
jgi:RNA polymerase sigma-70 factor (ECF subfamily)